MYNVIVGAVDGVLTADRLLEGLDDDLAAIFRPNGEANIERLLRLPTLLMPEVGDSRTPQVARVGNVVSLARSGRDVHFRFVKSTSIPDIPSARIEQAAPELGLGIRLQPDALDNQGAGPLPGATRGSTHRPPQTNSFRAPRDLTGTEPRCGHDAVRSGVFTCLAGIKGGRRERGMVVSTRG